VGANILQYPFTHPFWERATLLNYLQAYNHFIPQRAIGYQSPIDALKSWYAQHPDLFVKQVYKQAELDTKTASARCKPNGILVIAPNQAQAFIAGLPIGAFYGVGHVTEKKMLAHGIQTSAELLRWSREDLTALFGKAGLFFYDIVRGFDPRPVQAGRVRKSIGVETTLADDILALDAVWRVLTDLMTHLVTEMAKKKSSGRTLTLKVRYNDFTTITRSCTAMAGFSDAAAIGARLPRLLAATAAGHRKIRLLGLSVSNLDDGRSGLTPCQLRLPFCS
jgi:DNA polymerase-4